MLSRFHDRINPRLAARSKFADLRVAHGLCKQRPFCRWPFSRSTVLSHEGLVSDKMKFCQHSAVLFDIKLARRSGGVTSTSRTTRKASFVRDRDRMITADNVPML